MYPEPALTVAANFVPSEEEVRFVQFLHPPLVRSVQVFPPSVEV